MREQGGASSIGAMSTKPNDGWPALPMAIDDGTGEDLFHCKMFGEGGMTLRDYFAGQALGRITFEPSIFTREKEYFAAVEAACRALVAAHGGTL